ncbi:MAG: ABC transporter substrate-binding protein [Anaeromicrobium sp.]|uniref:ABC transporter substrate-binding protein n=1 Tax=Anaeromicrobium sp. TaxID=1929132 RepID=UPI0025D5491F|nr:ABC transporter substrate-binding protein [Anaeromicrobium sp.]MCT4594456.1 ABC transporter substrate-binding protein [Anaeromicrobium sp.]
MKKICLLICFIMLMGIGLTGCGTSENVSKEGPEEVTLTFLMHDQFQYEYFTETNNISEAYKKVNPNVTIEVEKVKDTGELENALKIRNSANELPDIMLLKTYMLSNFADILEPLNDTQVAKNNEYAEQYSIGGNIVGIPESAFYEFVYYRKSVFEKYGLEIPETWDEFMKTAQLIKEKGEYIPIVLGAKDSWPDYPYNEFMPCLQGGNGAYWNEMATKDEPFTKGEPFYEAYRKIQDLYDAKVFGQDPLGIGWDQAKSMFVAGKGAMIGAGQWFITDYKNMDGDMDDLGLFLLPVRDTKEDTFYATVMADGFYGTAKEGENKEEAIKFINWYMSSDYYLEYMKEKGINATIKGSEPTNPYLKEAFENTDAKFIVYDGGNKEFKRIGDSFGFDVKKLGQEMLAGKDFEEMMSNLNKRWKEAKNE